MIALLFAALAAPAPDPVEEVLASELDRAMAHLADREDPPYHVAATVVDAREWTLSATDGTLAADQHSTRRTLDVDLRVGSPELDNTHPLRGFSDLESDTRGTVYAPFDPDALRHALWREIDARYRDAAERIVVVRANRSVKIEEETPGADFELRDPVVYRDDPLPAPADLDGVPDALVAASRALAASPYIDRHEVRFVRSRIERTLVDTAGTRVLTRRRHARLSLSAEATARDGDRLSVFESVDVRDPGALDVAGTLARWTDRAAARMAALHDAPRGEPYSGPVLLEGQAAGVFFHEVLGHRVEGHRQKREDEGKTFAEHVGRPILPPFIDVYDDPTLDRLAGHDLNGHYLFDDEGVPAQRAPLVEGGVFVGFLLARSPIEGFEHSNGHGRRSPGNLPISRMGNTVVEARRALPRSALRQRLLDEVRAQGLDYGYIVEDIEGGFTQTGRTTPNAFNVRATASWRVWADGRPDELVRGIDLVGTPLVAFRNLIAAGDDPQVFNGTCGAESGWVPVSAVAPSLLFRTLEMQRKEKGQDRPMLLPRPPVDDGAADAGGAR